MKVELQPARLAAPMPVRADERATVAVAFGDVLAERERDVTAARGVPRGGVRAPRAEALPVQVRNVLFERTHHDRRGIAVAHDVGEQVLGLLQQPVLGGGERDSHVERAVELWGHAATARRSIDMRRRM